MSAEDARWMGGLETEYALSALGAGGLRLGGAGERLFDVAHRVLPSIPDGASTGMFLTNGGRFYLDAGGHPEMSTPETTNPWETVRYAMAGDVIVAGLAEEVVRADPTVHEMIVTRCNVDYSGTGSTWGSHESHLYRCSPSLVPRHLIPHFVSRIVFTGAGGFDNRAVGPEFVLSPRVPHLRHVESGESTNSRGIFHTKNEPLVQNRTYNRLHNLCGESLCSETASFLRIGTTALIVALVDAGKRPGLEVQLEDPVRAMDRFARDPSCTVTARSVRGKDLRAVDIQRHYLASVERHLGASFLPAWADEVCSEWRRVLDLLEEGPEAVSTLLDWSIKLSVFQAHSTRVGIEWESLPSRTEEARLGGALPDPSFVTRQQRQAEELQLLERLQGIERPLRAEYRACLERLQGARELPEPDPRFADFLRMIRQLYEIDTRFSQLGPKGVFTGLDGAGLLTHRVPGVGDPMSALTTPPERGRAKVRGIVVQELQKTRDMSTCGWTMVHDGAAGRSLDLSDPFTETAAWEAKPGMSGRLRERFLRRRVR